VSPAPSLHTVVSRIGEMQSPLPAPASVVLGLVALAAVGTEEIWLLARHMNTIAHEGAHAITGSAVGQRIVGVTLQPNATGATSTSGGGAPGNVTTSVAGYLGPSAFGVGAAKLIELGHSVAVLWLTLLLLLLLLVVLRSAFSFVPVLVTGGLIYVIARYASVGVESATAYGVAWFLLLSGVRVVLDHGVAAADAGNLAALTHIRPRFWVWVWLIGTIAALVFGGSLLV
jgi:Peptidase M50B-like